MEWKNTWLNYLLLLGLVVMGFVFYYVMNEGLESSVFYLSFSVFVAALLFSLIIYNKKNFTSEEKYVLEYAGEYISCKHPEKSNESVLWKEISKITVVTTDKGPHEPYLWVLLSTDTGKGCMFPLGATNSRGLLERIWAFKDFDLKQWSEAIKSTENKRFVVWAA